jgi:hypothetical protein
MTFPRFGGAVGVGVVVVVDTQSSKLSYGISTSKVVSLWD